MSADSARKTIFPAAFLVLAVISIAACQSSSPSSASTTKRSVSENLYRDLQQELERFRSRCNLPGVSVGFVLPGGCEGAVVAGLSDNEEEKQLQAGDRFLAGSIGKTYVAAVALQLVGEKKLDLDALIGRWLGDEKWFSRLPVGSYRIPGTAPQGWR